MSVPQTDPLISIGYVRKAHGITGELAAVFTAEDVSLLKGSLFLLPPGGRNSQPVKYTVKKVRLHHGSMILALSEVGTRNEAELLRHHSILVPKSSFAPLQEDEVYLFDLPGLLVIARDEQGAEREIGRIASVDVPAGQELWIILTPDGREILFPAVEEFILELDHAAGYARIAPPPGLLDLYLD